MDFIAYDPTVPPVGFHQLAPGKHFDDSGFVVMRSGWDENATVVGFRCGPAPGHRNQNDPRPLERRGFGPGHQHPGYVHMKTTGEHNTVLVNGHGQTESTPEYDYAIGDAGNIYVDEAGLAGFRRHLLYLRPGVVVVADDLAAKAPARFEWLLQALDYINRTGAGTFEIREGGVRLSVNPVLPAKYEPAIASREYRGSNLNGKLVTLNLRVEAVSRTRFLVVMAVLDDASAPAPQVAYANGRLSIRHGGRSWKVRVAEPVTTGNAARIFQVER